MQVLHMNGGDGENSYAKNSSVQVFYSALLFSIGLFLHSFLISKSLYLNSLSMQDKIISIAKPAVEEAVMGILNDNNIPESIGIADMGCSSGPNSLRVISEVMDVIYGKCMNLGRPSPEFRVMLNDLPSNDFNAIFESLPSFLKKLKEEKGAGFGPCFVAGVAGSFYGRVFPRNSLHFVHSSSSLHWLSQVSKASFF